MTHLTPISRAFLKIDGDATPSVGQNGTGFRDGFVPMEDVIMFRITHHQNHPPPGPFRVQAVMKSDSGLAKYYTCSPWLPDEPAAEAHIRAILTGESHYLVPTTYPDKKSELTQLKQQVNELTKKLSELEQALMYIPGGLLYQKVEEEFKQIHQPTQPAIPNATESTESNDS